MRDIPELSFRNVIWKTILYIIKNAFECQKEIDMTRLGN